MTDDLPPLERVETIGDDTPTLSERLGGLRRAHPWASGLLALALVAVVGVTGAVVWRSASTTEPPPPPTRPDGPLVRVASTGEGGGVRDRLVDADGTTVIVLIEVKVTIIGPSGLVGHVRGISGPGVQSSSARGIPPVMSGSSSVGLVASTVRCSDIGTGADYRLLVDTVAPLTSVVPAPLQGALDSVEPEWMALLARACGP